MVNGACIDTAGDNENMHAQMTKDCVSDCDTNDEVDVIIGDSHGDDEVADDDVDVMTMTQGSE